MASKKRPPTKSGTPRARKGVKLKPTELTAKDLRLVSETNLGAGDNLFEWIGGNRHHHLICRGCGSVSSLDEHHLDAFSDTLMRETGFEADLEHIAIFGLCSTCRAAGSRPCTGAGPRPGACGWNGMAGA